MKTIDLATEQVALPDLLALARQESVLLLTPDGREFLLAEANDSDREVAALRASQAFQRSARIRRMVSSGTLHAHHPAPSA